MSDPCPSGIAMNCPTCGGSGAVNFEDCKACFLKDGRIKVLEAEFERLQNSFGEQASTPISDEKAEEKIRALDQALNSAISSAVEARKERDVAEKALADMLAELRGNKGKK